MKRVMIVRYEKFVSTMTCEFEWHETDNVDIGDKTYDALGGNPDGGDTFTVDGTRVVAVSRGTVMVEVWEDPTKFDPARETRTVNGWKYQPKPEQITS